MGENIADNGGLRESYQAFQQRQAKLGSSPRLANLAKYSPEQLFFISYANVSSKNYKLEKIKFCNFLLLHFCESTDLVWIDSSGNIETSN